MNTAIHEGRACQSVMYLSYAPLVPEEGGSGYKFSKYVLDPNKFRFRKVALVTALMLLFIKNARSKTKRLAFQVTNYKTTDLLSGHLSSGDNFLSPLEVILIQNLAV